MLADAVAIVSAMVLAMLVLARFIPPRDYLSAIQRTLPVWLLAFAALRLYDLETVLEDSQEYATVATGCTYGIVLAVVVNAVSGAGDFPLLWLLAGWLFSIASVWTARFGMRRVVRAARRA
ncbi:MAG: hypothetical protein HY023_12775, partial [Chloroflexi bacterium]|nr:hypothetical protein [Chloroflexota bacterium]